jgi:trypsin-like peptidase/effector-associated domain 1 (EAD1)-containing protein
MDFEQLNGAQRKIIRQAILSALVDAGSIDMFLEGELSKPPLANFAGGANTEQQVFNLIRAAQAEGWTGDLISKLQVGRPRNTLVRNLPNALRLAAVEAPPRLVTPDMSLEKIVSGGGFADLRIWAEKMTTIAQTICRIEAANGTPHGTGLLVADDCVLTNYHVVENYIAGKLDPASIRCRFDYARDAKGLDEGRTVTLATGSTWIVAHSAYDAADLSGTGIPAGDHLDFALLRLSEAAGTHEVGGGARRGTLSVPRQSSLPGEKTPIFIVQHPKGTPLALAIGIVLGMNESGTRLRYDADTLNGSSGSGVFNQRLELAALHHAGDPTSKIRAQYNQGIPIGAIVTMLEGKGIDAFWR